MKKILFPKKAIAKKPPPSKRLLIRKVYDTAQCTYIYPEGHVKEGQRCGATAHAGEMCVTHGGDTIKKKETCSMEHTFRSNSFLVSSKFDPTIHPLKYIELSMNGMSPQEIAREFMVSITTITEWARHYDTFAKAKEVGETAYQAFWIHKGVSNLENGRFNTALFKFLSGNLIGFSDKIEQQSTNLHVHGVMRVPETVQNMTSWQSMAQENVQKLESARDTFIEDSRKK